MAELKKDKNCTTIFMVAPFGVGRERLLSNGFIGAYLSDIHKEDISNEKGIYFLFKPENIDEFEDFLYEEKERGANIVEDYDYEGGYVVVIYVLDDAFVKDYETFIKGKYSKFSKEFKSRFPMTIVVRGEDGREREEVTLQQRVFNKDSSIKEYWEEEFNMDIGDSELWSSPNMDKTSKEYLDIDKIRKLLDDV